MNREPLRDRMRGRWHGVLPELGVPSQFLNGKHQPCPMCGGRDRARFDDREGNGTWICSQCGAGDGVALVMRLNGWDFKTAADRIEAIMCDVQPTAPRPKADVRKQLDDMRRAWNAAGPIGEAVSAYLYSRGLNTEGVRDVRQNRSHEMLALMRDPQGRGCQVHRTLLTREGKKVEADTCRLFMPGPIAKGAAVRLMRHENALGIAEGIETALSAALLFSTPCWAALNANCMREWTPPEGVERVTVFADNDKNYTGHAAAYELARKLYGKVAVSVEIPAQPDTDWNDILRDQSRAA